MDSGSIILGSGVVGIEYLNNQTRICQRTWPFMFNIAFSDPARKPWIFTPSPSAVGSDVAADLPASRVFSLLLRFIIREFCFQLHHGMSHWAPTFQVDGHDRNAAPQRPV